MWAICSVRLVWLLCRRPCQWNTWGALEPPSLNEIDARRWLEGLRVKYQDDKKETHCRCIEQSTMTTRSTWKQYPLHIKHNIRGRYQTNGNYAQYEESSPADPFWSVATIPKTEQTRTIQGIIINRWRTTRRPMGWGGSPTDAGERPTSWPWMVRAGETVTRSVGPTEVDDIRIVWSLTGVEGW